ncbi:hypothetical protein FDK21_12655 [Cohaesibacter sp. CAU 1516]|uniref:DUF6101 family protein n=1 Tax=Cohaesibacter sp. CAU 1516 TaxID=2576038 RepID=UPI0010FE923F|nr:DUF6101 family protein [Cohaesibacter sp. CAU 1516]TLP45590.1 hypothetical protein FDK21_12655 [Cohaesibacter sp. CAU 1516]
MRRQDNHKYTQAISYQVEGSARIDPHNLKKFFQTSEIRKKAATLTGLPHAILFGESRSGMVQIKSDHALVECALTCGLPLIVRVPMGYYQGIGARFVVGNREGNPLVCILELVHKDPSLSVPVAVSTDLEDIAIDWQSWSRRYDLTMLHQPLGSGDYVAAESNGTSLSGLSVAKQQPRRPHAQFSARRPRFLARRKTGLAGQMPALKGREIIARD